MRKENYSESYIENGEIKNTESWQMLLEKYIPDEELSRVAKEGLEATKPIYKNNNKTGKIELVKESPDYSVRHKYLETGLKMKGKLSEKGNELPQGNQYHVHFHKDEKVVNIIADAEAKLLEELRGEI